MKPVVLVLAAALGVALADIASLRAKLPKCSIECIAEGAAEHDCVVTDLDCQCSKMEAITATVAPCLARSGCELEEITDTASIVAKICAEQIASSNDTSKVAGNHESPSSTAAPAEKTDEPGAAGRLQMAGWLGFLGLTAAALL